MSRLSIKASQVSCFWVRSLFAEAERTDRPEVFALCERELVNSLNKDLLNSGFDEIDDAFVDWNAEITVEDRVYIRAHEGQTIIWIDISEKEPHWVST